MQKVWIPGHEITTENARGAIHKLLIWAIYKNAACLFIIGAFLYFCSRLIKNRKE